MNEQPDQPTAFYVSLDATRLAAGLTVAKACEVIGISNGTWQYWKAHEPTAAKQKRSLKRLADVGVKPTIVGKEPAFEPEVELRDGQANLPVFVPSEIRVTAEEFNAALARAKRTPEECQGITQKFVKQLRHGSEAIFVKQPTIASIGAPLSHGIIPPVEVPDQRAAITKPEPQYVRFNG